MKHESLMNEKDRADMARSDALTTEARTLRKRVLARLRARAHKLRNQPEVQ
jgi:hypothetical protein